MADLFMIHGAGDSAAVWGRQLEYFSARAGHRAFAIDLPGHGERVREQAYERHDLNAEEVCRIMDKHGVGAGVIAGHSMGGAVALMLALERPERVKALVLVATGAKMRMHPAFIEEAKRRAEAFGSSIPEATHIVPVEQMLSAATAPETISWLKERIGKASAQATYADFLANDRFDVMNRLGEIKAPTLVIGGGDDRMTPPKFSQYLADNIPGAQLEILSNVGHYPMVEQAELFNRSLERFLQTIS